MSNALETTATEQAMHAATYSPEDNKLRLYAAEYLDDDTYAEVKAAGFRWAPKQELFVAPSWSPEREDLLLELCGEIDDENTSAADRAADRAERFGGYREKRRHEAHGHVDTFDAGPGVFGHQNRQRAERAATRHDRHRSHAVTQWSKAEYWQHRTEGVIDNALYKLRPSVRRGRILKIEAAQRKHAKHVAQAVDRYDLWQQIAAEPDTDRVYKLAYALANTGGGWNYTHPRKPDGETSLHYLLTDPADPITGHEAAALALASYPEGGPNQPGSHSHRWTEHDRLRLTYERAMLANEGGTAADADIEPGGFFGKHQVERVYKSPKTGRVVSIGVWGPHPWRTNGDGTPEMGTQKINIERFPENAYRGPTDEERATFTTEQKAKKTKAKATSKASPTPTKLINPTREAAQALQDALNEKAGAYSEKHNLRHIEPVDVWEMTQDEYKARSKGSYSVCHTEYLGRGLVLHERTTYYRGGEPKTLDPVCKVRIGNARQLYGPDRVIVISDKPQKPLPDWTATPAAEQKAEAVTA